MAGAKERWTTRLSNGASGLMIALVALWSYWSAGEMYHEGWWGSWLNRLPYLAPMLLTLIPALVAFRWPLWGGALIGAVGVFVALFFRSAVSVIGLAIALVGLVFVAEGLLLRRHAARASAADGGGPASDPRPWWRRRWRYALAIGLPVIIFAAMSAVMLPVVLGRVDDGDRGVRLIEGNGVSLVWAPEGPGWNWRQPFGGYPSWQSIALYGVEPVGMGDKPGFERPEGDTAAEDVQFATEADMARYNLCRYLSADGTTLEDEPPDIWRMPTTDELVRSLVRHGEHAACTWDGEYQGRASCAIQPDKESPLWATDVPVIYYWTADARDARNGAFVAFNGSVNATYKRGGNPRHSHRCVREP
jgi:hypothetical protein